MVRVLALVEGQTEERFVNSVLQPYLADRDIYIKPRLLVTRRVLSGQNFKGGVRSFGQVVGDLRQLLRDSDAAAVTTLLDLYRIPKDWPGVDTPSRGTRKAKDLEASLLRAVQDRRLLPFLMVHEFEAILFCNPTQAAGALGAPESVGDDLASVRRTVSSPEEINDGATTHPSARIRRSWPAYRKVLDGSAAAGRIGVGAIREQCPHFAEWLTGLEGLSG